MSAMGAAFVGAAGGLLGGALTNASSAKRAREAMAFEAQQSHAQMVNNNWMSSTAHWREVQDLKSAGLNPILSATGGPGAPVGSSAKGSGSSIAPVNELGEAVNSALAARRNHAEVKNMEKTNENIDMDTQLKLEQKRAAHESIYRTKWESDLTEEQFASERSRRRMLDNQVPGSNTEAEIDRSRYGQGLRYADRIGKTIGSALGARRLFQQH